MNIKCMLGIHDWQDCKCRKCGKLLDQASPPSRPVAGPCFDKLIETNPKSNLFQL